MNPKQTAPLLLTLGIIAPPLLIGGAIGLALVWLFSDDKKETKPVTVPANPKAKRRTTLTAAPATVARAPFASPLPVATVAPNVPLRVPAPAPAIVSVEKTVVNATPPPPIKKKFVTREDMATIFQQGARTLTRTTAVDALKNLGFCKTTAYKALSENGRFAFWLEFAPDGRITWNG